MYKKKPYYPNNWKAYKDAPDEFFIPMPFEQLMDWKLCGWELPSSVGALIRETSLKTGRVKEYVYQRSDAAEAKVRKIMAEGESEFVVATPNEIHHLFPKEYFENDDYDYEID
tara:strand:+ start:128 stop:466 length:339 start_codon:yes stop_codon:yes gene_type:complete